MNAVTQWKPTPPPVSEAEWTARVDLPACYRLADVYGMSDMIYTHISARLPHEPDEFLIIAHGMLFSEVTASSLLKVDLEGNVAYKPDLPYGLQLAGFVIHSAIYKARPDVMAVMPTPTVVGRAVAALESGPLPPDQTPTGGFGRPAPSHFPAPPADPGG